VTYGACLIILACAPSPSPEERLDTGLDDAVTVSPQAQRMAHYSIDSNALLMKSDEEVPPYSERAAPVLPLRFVEQPREQVQQQRGVGYSPKYNTSTPGSWSAYSVPSPNSIMEVDYKSLNYVDERRLLPGTGPSAYPASRAPPQTPVSIYSTRTIQAPTGFASGPNATYLPAPPPVAQFNGAQRPQPRRPRSSSTSSSIYSSMSGEFRQGIPPPMPYMTARWVASEQQSVRSITTSSVESDSSQSSQWKKLVLDAAAGRRQASF